MASYVVAGSKAGVQVVSQTEVLQVQLVNIYTTPHNSYVIVPVPSAAWLAGHSGTYLEPIAANIEELWTQTLISGTQYVQDVDQSSNLIAAFVDFTVSINQANPQLTIPYTTVVRIALSDLAGGDFFGKPSGGTAPSTAITAAFSRLELEAGV